MNKKTRSINVPWDMLRPVPPFLHEELVIHSLLLKHRNALRHTEATIPRHHLPHLMNGLRHVKQELCIRVPLVLPRRRKGPPTVCQLRPILPLDQSNPPHDMMLSILIAVRNGMVLILKWPRILGADHQPRGELVEPTVHRFIEAAEPRRRILPLIVLVEGRYHRPNLVEPILEQQGLSLVRVSDGAYAYDVEKSSLRDVRFQPNKWSPLELVDQSR